ncbi:MAG: maleylpyruvate isomerase family mycothiol-dependent enzyme [Modestobacter sp.]|nr:maleylpyruvate isomerase family mycothiol-dependent enzyme [Modestobacter sp.]
MDRDAYLVTLHAEGDRFAEAAAAARQQHGWRARVPGCPEWDLADLVWHLGEVQHFWGWIVRTRATSPAGYPEPARPDDESLPAWAAERSRELADALTRAEPTDPVWTWAPQQDVAFVLRRQAQEATVHRVDAEQVLGQVTPILAEVGLDGLDEWLELMVPAVFPGGAPTGAFPVVFRATDAASGVGAERVLFPDAEAAPVHVLTGPAGDLLLVAWRRLPLRAVAVEGDADKAEALLASVTLA